MSKKKNDRITLNNNIGFKTFPDYQKMGFAVIFEQKEDGYFLTVFKSKRKAIHFLKKFYDWLYKKLSAEESVEYENCFNNARHYKINLLNAYTTFFTGCYIATNGIQSVYVMAIDLEFFNLDLFCWERQCYVTSLSEDVIENISSQLHQELLYRIIPN